MNLKPFLNEWVNALKETAFSEGERKKIVNELLSIEIDDSWNENKKIEMLGKIFEWLTNELQITDIFLPYECSRFTLEQHLNLIMKWNFHIESTDSYPFEEVNTKEKIVLSTKQKSLYRDLIYRLQEKKFTVFYFLFVDFIKHNKGGINKRLNQPEKMALATIMGYFREEVIKERRKTHI